MLRDVYLHGEMRRLFGPVFRLDVASPAEAVRALGCVVDGFKRHLSERARAGQNYRVRVGKNTIGEKELPIGSPDSASPIHITPVVSGAKSGLFGVIAGVALFVAGFFTGGATWYGMAMMAGGAALAAAGAMQMLAPKPQTSSRSDSNGNKSHIYGSVDNVSAQGAPIVMRYGKSREGSTIISAGIRTV